jgi:glycosyltransferase involved in cell wall biosynthesis
MAVFGPKHERDIQILASADTPAGSQIGAWMIRYTTGPSKAGKRPYRERLLKTRPRMRLSVGILAGNSEHDIVRCIDSLWAMVDEIVVGDTGSTDATKELLEQFDRKVKVIDIAPIAEQPEGFAGARNQVRAACSGEWFLWIDTDEILISGMALRAYLEAGKPFRGFAIKQNHFQLDAPFHFDTPIRVFRNIPEIQFYGCVHEQPQLNDCNGEIVPALQLEDVQIAHFGYLVAGLRKHKALTRNLPLLEKDQHVFPDRRLGKVLVLRDLSNLGDWTLEETRGFLSLKARMYFEKAIRLFHQEFPEPGDVFHDLARPFYEHALQALGMGTEVELSLAGRQGGLGKARAKPRRVWVLHPEELEKLWAHQTQNALKKMRPDPTRVDPILPAPTPRDAVAV